MLQEVAQATHGVCQGVFPGEKNDAQVLFVINVEGGALNQQNFFLQQQVEHQLFIVDHREVLRVESREQVQGTLGFDTADAGNVVEHAPGGFPLFIQPAAGCYQIVDGLVATQRRLDGQLCRNVGTQAHV